MKKLLMVLLALLTLTGVQATPASTESPMILQNKINTLQNKINTLQNKINTLQNKINTLQNKIPPQTQHGPSIHYQAPPTMPPQTQHGPYTHNQAPPTMTPQQKQLTQLKTQLKTYQNSLIACFKGLSNLSCDNINYSNETLHAACHSSVNKYQYPIAMTIQFKWPEDKDKKIVISGWGLKFDSK